jgi:hypothetical protein
MKKRNTRRSKPSSQAPLSTPAAPEMKNSDVLLLMPPSGRYLDNAYPKLSAMFGIRSSNIEEHMRAVCLYVFQNRNDICKHLPFQDTVEPWDIEYAIRKYEEETYWIERGLRWGRMPVSFNNEMVWAFYDRWHGADARPSLSTSTVRLDLDIDDDTDEEEEEEERNTSQDRSFHIEYAVERHAIVTQRRRIIVYVNNAAGMSFEELKNQILTQIRAGDCSDVRIRNLDPAVGEIIRDSSRMNTFNVYDNNDLLHDEETEDFSGQSIMELINTSINNF